MNYWNSLFKAFCTIGLILTLGVSMNACGIGTEHWKEEVQLSDGRVVIVEREIVRESGGDEWAFNRSGSKPKEYVIKLVHPDRAGEKVEWRSIKKSPRTWPEIPLVFDLDHGRPLVFTLVAVSIGCEVYSKYVYRNGAWEEETLPEQFEPRMTNLFLKLGVDMPSIVNIERKTKTNSSGDYYRALKQVGPTKNVCGIN